MKRECKGIPDVVKAIQGDRRRTSLIVGLKGKKYHFVNGGWIKGADLLLKILIENYSEMRRLLVPEEKKAEDNKLFGAETVELESVK